MCWTALTANCFSICDVLGVVFVPVFVGWAYVFVVSGIFGVKVLGDLATGHAIEGIHLDVSVSGSTGESRM